MLAIAAVLSGPVAGWLHIKEGKRPLPLVAPLATLNEEALAPYRVVRRHTLGPELVEALGTEIYLSWTLIDTSLPLGDPLRIANLLVTYDSGGENNLVPHTPDVCYLGVGYAAAQPHETVELGVPGLGTSSSTIPVRVCTFGKTAIFGYDRVSVTYTFHCNGRFVGTRTGVRYLLNKLTNTYAYFSKVEISFPEATREETVKGVGKLYGRVLPLLVADHWPDFEKMERAARNDGRDD